MINISFKDNFVMTRAYPDRKKYPACLLVKGEVVKALTKKDLKEILETRKVVDHKGREHELTYKHALALHKNMKRIGMRPKKIGQSYKVIMRFTVIGTEKELLCKSAAELSKQQYHLTSLGYTQIEEIKDKDVHCIVFERKYPVNLSGVPDEYFRRNTLAKLLTFIEQRGEKLLEGKVYTSDFSADKGHIGVDSEEHIYTYTLEKSRICVGVAIKEEKN